MGSVEDARKKWIEERPAFEEFAGVLEARLKQAMKPAGFWFDVRARAKTLESLVKKLLKDNSKHTYDSVSDKVGARVIVRYLSELDRVTELAEAMLHLGTVENKLSTLGHERFGYLSIHVDHVTLRPDDPDHSRFPATKFFAELQVRTLAQHLWSEMSHDTAYKTVGEGIPPSMKRRVNLMAGQIEVADREFDRIGAESPNTLEGSALTLLERHYYRLSTRRPDIRLTLEILRKLLPDLGLPPEHFAPEGALHRFLSEHETALAAAYERPESVEMSSLAHQPEALLLYERLMRDELGTRRSWNTNFPEKELERLAAFFGISFE
jgi:ppGpp synthetase/RelA/SpoT-type nucleotidyltranferase